MQISFVLKCKHLSYTLSKQLLFRELLAETLSPHPFDKNNYVWPRHKKDLKISVVVYSLEAWEQSSLDIPCVDDDNFPKIFLHLQVCNYIGEDNPLLNTDSLSLPVGSEQQERIKRMLYHEFGHVIDKQNPEFGYSQEVRDMTIECNLKSYLNHVWNFHIDGRLTEYNLSPKTWDERVKETGKISSDQKVQEMLRQAWSSQFLTFDQLINVSKDLKEVAESNAVA